MHALGYRCGFVISVFVLACLTAEPAALGAQGLRPGSFDAPAPPRPTLSTHLPDQIRLAEVQERPTVGLGRVLTGTALGGVAGGALGGLIGVGIGSMGGQDDGFISAQEAFGVIGFAVGYTGGAALGARRAATVGGARPGLGRTLLVSVATAALGGLVWNQVGELFESEESMSSWYAGAALGVGTHWVLTAHLTRNAPVSDPR